MLCVFMLFSVATVMTIRAAEVWLEAEAFQKRGDGW